MSHANAVLLKKPAPPADFEVFWTVVVEESRQLPLTYERDHREGDDLDTHSVYRLQWQGATRETRQGWFLVPKESPADSLPGVLYLPGYGVSAVPPNPNIAFEGLTTLSVNLQSYPLTPVTLYEPSLGYLTQGIETPESYVYRRIVLDCLLALRILQAQPEADPLRLHAAGLSQGGGLALILGAWANALKSVVAEMPFMTYWEYLIGLPVHRYPLKELTDYLHAHRSQKEHVMHTLQYFDTVHHAPFLRCPAQISVGLKDPSIRVPVALSVYDALPRPKRMIVYEHTGHDWTPEMRPYLEEWVRAAK
ncbi:MAG: acetylxylan esterase [Fimbriimonadia bacterium]|nr:acetylxylan esterase [Fimbriimonadia bacterium]